MTIDVFRFTTVRMKMPMTTTRGSRLCRASISGMTARLSKKSAVGTALLCLLSSSDSPRETDPCQDASVARKADSDEYVGSGFDNVASKGDDSVRR